MPPPQGTHLAPTLKPLLDLQAPSFNQLEMLIMQCFGSRTWLTAFVAPPERIPEPSCKPPRFPGLNPSHLIKLRYSPHLIGKLLNPTKKGLNPRQQFVRKRRTIGRFFFPPLRQLRL
ncbi:hypothetical protein NL676_002049 [Syzygium grande]|nr:hypothetical protein NL676_002049 [Syzygium grande]